MIKVITHIKSIKIDIDYLPESYAQFLKEYGYGCYCGLINITQPDEQVIYSTFSDFDFWEFDSNFTNNDLKEAVQLGSTIDGDIICCLKNKGNILYILPRNSEIILSFKNLDEMLSFYNKEYKLLDFYFEPSQGRKIASLSLIHEDKLLDINTIRTKFLRDFEYDYVIGEEQPKYVIKKIGGWVKFDLVYKNSIAISYQEIESTKDAHRLYFEFLKKAINELSIAK